MTQQFFPLFLASFTSLLLLLRVFVCTAAHLQLLLPLQGKLFKRLDDDSRVGAVVHEDGRAPHPRLQVVDGQRDVLGVVLKNTKRENERLGEERASCLADNSLL